MITKNYLNNNKKVNEIAYTNDKDNDDTECGEKEIKNDTNKKNIINKDNSKNKVSSKKDGNRTRSKNEDSSKSESYLKDSKNKVSFIDDIMHIIFLGVGASSLSIVKVPYYIGLISTIIYIIFIGIITRCFSYFLLIDIIDKTNNKKEKKEDKKACFLIEICKDLNSLNTFNIPFIIGEIIIHQILIYRSLGGIVNIIGEFNYDSVFMFLSDTYWREFFMKFVVNIIFCLFLLNPLCLNINDKTINAFPIIGFNIILFIVLGVFIQFFNYFINYCITGFNFRDLSIYPYKRESAFKFFQSLLGGLLSNAISVVDVNFNYQSETDLTREQFGVDIVKEWERFYFETNLGYGGEMRTLESDDAVGTNLVGDVLVGYKITPMIHVYVFNRTNTNDFTRSELPFKQGGGLKLTHDFNNWGELFRKKKN